MGLSKIITPRVLKGPNLAKQRCLVRFVTGDKYNSGISHPNAGVGVLFLNNKSESALRFVSRVNPEGVPRFEKGNVDTICFDDVELEDVSQIWIYPEQGEWDLHSVVLEDTTTKRFACDAFLGTDETPCGLLTSEDAPSYDEALYKAGMENYDHMKRRLLCTDFYLTVLGTCAAYATTGDTEVSKAFLEGGVLGILYMYMLEKQIDFMGSLDKSLLFPLVSAPVRLFLISYLSISSVGFSEQRLLAPFALGFFMYKIAVIIASFGSD